MSWFWALLAYGIGRESGKEDARKEIEASTPVDSSKEFIILNEQGENIYGALSETKEEKLGWDRIILPLMFIVALILLGFIFKFASNEGITRVHENFSRLPIS
jgi:hypothetical protein